MVSGLSSSVPVMAFSRLFGSKQKPKPSVSDQGSDNAASEDEGFTMVGGASQREQQQQPAVAPRYPALPGSNGDGSAITPSPYPPPGTSAAANYNTLTSQSSVSAPHALDGVPFALAPHCAPSSELRELDRLLAEAQTCLDSAQTLVQSSNYDFRLEKSVVDSDVSATLKRMQPF